MHDRFGNRRRRSRTPLDLVAGAHRLDALEPRVHLSAYTFESLAETFDFPGVLRDLEAPEGVETAGYGAAAAALGDIDGDGTVDFAIAAPGQESGDEPAIAGRVFLYSGATGDLIRTLEDGFAGFGSALASIGDVNDDGVADLIVGSPIATGTGIAYIFSGADGAVLHTVAGTDPQGELGFAVAAAGDLDGDGVPDALVGAPGAGPEGQGQVMIVSGATGSVVETITGEAAGDRFGAAVISVGDLPAGGDPEGDGVPDVFIGAPGSDGAGEDAGRAYLYDGASGAVRFTLDGAAAGDAFGAALGVVGTGADAWLLVGAPGADVSPFGTEVFEDGGEALRFNAAGEPLPTQSIMVGGGGGWRFGSTITLVGDIDGDGVADLAFGRPGADAASGAISFRSGADLEPIGVDAVAGGPIGPVAVAAGDVDGDGFDDVILADAASGRARLVSSLALVRPEVFNVASDDLSMIFYNPVPLFGGHRFVAIIDGVATPLISVPGLTAADVVVGVNNSGLLVVQPRPQGQDPAPTGSYTLVVGGVRTALADAVDGVVGEREPDLDSFGLVKVGNDGSILFNESLDGGGTAAWLFKDGVLTFLWLGTVDDVNDSGTVVGNPAPVDGTAQTPVLRAADGTITELTGLATARRVNNHNQVLGGLAVEPDALDATIIADGPVAIWSDGEVTAPEPAGLNPQAQRLRWRITDFNDEGAAVLTAVFQVPAGRGGSLIGGSTIFTLQPDLGLVPLHRTIFGDRVSVDNTLVGPPVRLAEDGRILLQTGVLEPLDPAVLWTLRPGSPVGAADGSLIATGVNTLGEPVVLLNVDGQWRAVVGDLRQIQGEVFDVISYVDPNDTGTYVFVLTTEDSYWGRVGADGQIGTLHRLTADPAAAAIAGQAALFVSADGRVHLAGVDAGGDLVIYYQTGVFVPSSALNWNFDNLVQTHLAPQDLEFAPVASNLTAFATPWGSSHIGYLDEAGSLHVVWIAPGGSMWGSVDLTANAGAERLSGVLTSFVTPWQTLHFNAADADGDIVAVWWAPGFEGQWRADVLTAPGSSRLDPASLTAFITPWNAMHIMGRDAQTGDVTALWWAPATQEWRLEAIDVTGLPEGLTLTGETAGSVTGGETLNLFAAADDGRLTRIFWSPGDGAVWTFEDVTAGTGLLIA